MRFLVGAWLFCLIGYILTGCSEAPKEKISYAIPVSNLLIQCQEKHFNNIYSNCTDQTGTLHFDYIYNATNVIELKD